MNTTHKTVSVQTKNCFFLLGTESVDSGFDFMSKCIKWHFHCFDLSLLSLTSSRNHI